MSCFCHSYLCNTATDILPTGDDPPGSDFPQPFSKATGCHRAWEHETQIPCTQHFAPLTVTLSYPYFQPKSAYKSFKGEGNKYGFVNSTVQVCPLLAMFLLLLCAHSFLQESRTERRWFCTTIWTLVDLEHEQVIQTPKLLKKSSLFQSITWRAKISLKLCKSHLYYVTAANPVIQIHLK